jgi:hypothetical protein
MRDRRSLIALAALHASLCLGCTAQPPASGENQSSLPSKWPFASLAYCTPASACPGSACAENSLGAPDGIAVEMSECPTLDIAMTGGEIVAHPESENKADIVLHFGDTSGDLRVEGSQDGSTYVVLGYLAKDSTICPIALEQHLASVSLSDCNSMPKVSYLRLVLVSGSISIDAVEAVP